MSNVTDFGDVGPRGSGKLTERLAWARSIWQVARTRSFTMKYMGTSSNSVIQRITELTTIKGASRAVLQLVADLEHDGVAGDANLEDREEALRAFEQFVQYDQLRTATRNKGKLSDKRSTVNFRNQSKDRLGQFFANRIDQIVFLSLAGVDIKFKNNMGERAGFANADTPPTGSETQAERSAFFDLDFRADNSGALTQNRHLRCMADGTIRYGDTTAVTASDKLNYKSLVRAKAFAKETGMRGVKMGSEEVFHMFVTPQGMADLRLDPDFLENVRNAGVRGDKNQLFAGATSVMVDGLVIHEYKLVPNTLGAAGGSKWGSGGTVDGIMSLILGAQALGFADFGAPEWNEKTFDYGNNHGIATAKVFGVKRPHFQNDWTGQSETYGVLRLDAALSPLTSS